MDESTIFRTARKLQPSELARFLKQACGDNKDLRSGIEELLAIHQRYECSTPENRRDADTQEQLPSSMHLGRYQLREVIGEGGMGVVYLADQLEPVQRQVALKLMRGYGVRASHLARFEQECQMLAVLDHPNIAKVLDAGTSSFESGSTPTMYLVMEYLKGKPVTQYCEENHLTIRERITLMVPVCQAIQHAHQKGVIHRDIKPGNILVCQFDEKAIPKVIDFGVAKWQESKSTPEQLQTEAGALIGTLDYIAPEQAELKPHDIDTRSDIYSLGVVLYELLVGVRPHDRQELQRLGYRELLDYLKNKEIVKPSSMLMFPRTQGPASGDQVSSRSSLKHEIQGDLDWIVMKCLEKDRNHRYETAAELGMDLSRYLNDEAVHAGPPGWQYKLQKFYRKHRSTVLAACILIITLLGGIITSAIGWKRALDAELLAEGKAEQVVNALKVEEILRVEVEKQRDRARDEKQAADAVTSFLQTKLLAQGDYRIQVNSLLKQIGDYESAEQDPRISKLLQRAEAELTPEKINTNFPNQPLVQARLLQTVGETYMNASKPVAAVQLLERALKLHQQHLPDQKMELISLMNNLGIAYIKAGQFRQAVSVLSEVLHRQIERYGEKSLGTNISRYNLAIVYEKLSDYRRARELLEETIRLQEGLEAAHPSAMHRKSKLGVVLAHLGKMDDAIRLQQEVSQLQSKTLGEDHPDTLCSLHNLAIAYHLTGRLNEALAIHEKVYSKRQALLGPTHPETLSTADELGLSYHDNGRLNDAADILELCYRERLASLPSDHHDLLEVMSKLGTVYRSQGKLETALNLFKSAYDKSLNTLGPEHALSLTLHNNIGSVYFSSARFEEAVKVFEEVVSRKGAKMGKEHRSTLTSLNSLAASHANLKNYDKAVPLMNEVIELRSKSLGHDHPLTLASQFSLAVTFSRMGKLNDALKLMEEVYSAREKKLGPIHADTIVTLEQLGILYQRAKNHDRAIDRYGLALKRYSAQPGTPETKVNMARANLGMSLKEAGRFSEAIEVLEPAFKVCHKYANLTFVERGLLDCYLQVKDNERAEKTVKQILVNAKARHTKNPVKHNSEFNTLEKRLQQANQPGLAALVSRELKQAATEANK